MTGAFAVAGITQVYLERRVGMDFLAVQEAVQVHFLGLVLAAVLFTAGISLYIWTFIRYGHPLKAPVQGEAEAEAETAATLPTPAK